MLRPDVKFGPIIPMRQSFDASCVPTAISMTLSGFGINFSEGKLIEQYFPTAALKGDDINAGVRRHTYVRGIVQVLSDLGVSDRLQMDVFLPHYWEFTNSSQNRFIVKSDPSAAAREKRISRGSEHLVEFNKTLEELARRTSIGLYSVNKRLIKSEIIGKYSNDERFYDELSGWLAKGHSVGVHGGLTCHVWAVDGYRSTSEAVHVIDPAGESYTNQIHNLVRTDYLFGIRADWFDFILRVSEKGPVAEKGFDRSRTWQDFKNRVSLRG